MKQYVMLAIRDAADLDKCSAMVNAYGRAGYIVESITSGQGVFLVLLGKDVDGVVREAETAAEVERVLG